MSENDQAEENVEEIVQAKPKSTVPRRFARRASDLDSIGTSPSPWLITFTDIIALMLTFFVLLFSMSVPKKEDWERFTQNVNQNFNKFEGKPENRGTEDAINISKINLTQALDLSYLKAIISKMIEEEPELGVVELFENGDSLIVAFPSNLLFEPGQATVRTQANKALFSLANTLGRIKNRIEVVGHTDPRPINTEQFPSNWELSLARATNVAAVLENVGYDRPITVRGYSSARYEEIPETVSQTTRENLSRRVDIVIMEDDGRKSKLFDIGLQQ